MCLINFCARAFLSESVNGDMCSLWTKLFHKPCLPRIFRCELVVIRFVTLRFDWTILFLSFEVFARLISCVNIVPLQTTWPHIFCVKTQKSGLLSLFPHFYGTFQASFSTKYNLQLSKIVVIVKKIGKQRKSVNRHVLFIRFKTRLCIGWY